jgi:hypothetical protein
MKLRTIIYLVIGGMLLSIVLYYLSPHKPIPEGITVDKIVILKSERKLFAYSQGAVVQRWKDWTTGCIALTNEEIDDLYMHTPLGTRVEIEK